jgi:hypothetical protein
MKTAEDFKAVTTFMAKRKFIQIDGDLLKIDLRQEMQ